ncbi:MAG: peptidoglycan -binding protein [Paracoccaceae bacterium]|nr:peptidoglycan -binding protein [Paracoccaceae bacterium]
MALARRAGGRIQQNTWPGFVDAMTALLLILMFVMSIFMIIQFTMHQKLTGQTKELDQLNLQLADLANVLSLERDRSAALEEEVGSLQANVTGQRSEIDRLGAALAAMTQRAETGDAEVTRLNAAMAVLASARDAAEARNVELESQLDETVTEGEVLAAALASARSEMDAAAEEARLAAARREALEALVADLQAREAENADAAARAAAAESRLSEEEKARLAEAAAAEALRKRLENSAEELDAMTLALEQARNDAEDTLTLLAAAESAKRALEEQAGENTSAFDREEALRLLAEQELSKATAQTLAEQRRVALLNAQIRALREQLGGLQALLDDADARDAEAEVQIARLGERLNAALAQKVGELARFRSVFFEKMEQVLGGREDIKRVGDRFVFQSEVLFGAGSATLGGAGQSEISKLGTVLREVADEMPEDLNWILRVDGHTDKIPVGGRGRYRDNWELSQGRALSVVRYLIEHENVPPDRLVAAGFGEFQPIDEGDEPEALARNRRIEFKFTER